MKIKLAIPAIAAAALLALTGCTNADGVEREQVSTDVIEGIKADPAAVKLLPADVAESGELRIGVNPNYAPIEYKDENGVAIGWGIDLGDAVAAKLGLTPKWEHMNFDSIIPRVQEGGLDMSSSSFTDTVERQKSVDFVNYLNAGSQWAAKVGEDVDPENACGLTVAVKATTIQEQTELPARSEKCVAAGKEPIEILILDQQPEVTQAVIDGRAVAFSADSPVSGDAAVQLSDQIELVGEVFDAAPYGLVTPKDSELTKAVQAAMQSLMDDGTYLEILTSAGAQDGALTEATINAGEK
ncbi:polar amino acid transport system substrate-binding protein [Leucobacter exalbidus]|uniref:Polar amino acid transport system substrate-binding protein n=1 Tax=Leucobacter exalbidus TaxID=662960 RepID=A0A940PMF2_9MICO|nr:ABC transporter substrate-binding protein [Leucobacter exalbidus]MBP1326617.1 polar amino acid transport system substrate-binding protein [Leucobacter exalbidus]